MATLGAVDLGLGQCSNLLLFLSDHYDVLFLLFQFLHSAIRSFRFISAFRATQNNGLLFFCGQKCEAAFRAKLHF